MKNKFATVDLFAVIHDLQKFVGMRVINVYDIDSRTYLLKLQRPEEKVIILFECGARIHQTTHDWPKSQIPSQFSMKFRKHINQKRLISIKQLGVDRIVDMQFGEDDRACHVIVEIYDRGNVILTDHNYIILNILRPRTDKDTDVKFSVKEKYPIDNARKSTFLPSKETIQLFLANSKKGEILRKALIKHVPFSSALLDHSIVSVGLPNDVKIGVDLDASEESVEKVKKALDLAEIIQDEIRKTPSKGYITYQKFQNSDDTFTETYNEYHPYDFIQFRQEKSKYLVHECETFGEAVDRFYSVLDEQKVEQKALNAEKQAMKKLENVKKDHEIRVKQLEELQEIHVIRASRIEFNKDLVDQALLLVRSAIANKLSWDEIKEWLQNLAERGVVASKSIVRVNLASNEVTMKLKDPFDEESDYINVDIDIDLSASQNARKFYSDKKYAAEKQQKTLAASSKALKSAQMQTKTKIDQVRAHTNLLRSRKPMWFEKFYWFISSDKYLVIAGRDFQQNELLVKRYLRAGDIYVHADIHGACSVVIRNRKKDEEIPPRTINEAGTMAMCYSSAWEAKIVVSAWWVRHDQVSRTAQTGEYLPAGAFMIRGKKNFIPASQLQLGFGLMFRLDEESAAKHKALESQNTTALVSNMSINEDDIEENDEELKEEENGDEDVEKDEEEKDEEEKDEDNKNEDDEEFPDVEIGGGKVSVMNEGTTDEYTLVRFTQPNKGIKKVDEREKYLQEKKKKEEVENQKKKQEKQQNKPLTKRQKHKLDKIKKKYKDQDEEEREMRMKLLGIKKPEIKLEDLKAEEDNKKVPKQQQQKVEKEVQNDEEDDDFNEEDVKTENDEEAKIINELCYKTLDDDSLLYVTAVCAPYQIMQKYKYKVKITPGTGKRGKAAKMALQLFLRDKTAAPAEINLIKGLVSDTHIASNIPAKVRVSAPQLLKMKK